MLVVKTTCSTTPKNYCRFIYFWIRLETSTFICSAATLDDSKFVLNGSIFVWVYILYVTLWLQLASILSLCLWFFKLHSVTSYILQNERVGVASQWNLSCAKIPCKWLDYQIYEYRKWVVRRAMHFWGRRNNKNETIELAQLLVRVDQFNIQVCTFLYESFSRSLNWIKI